MTQRANRSGFTLVEMLVVIAIIVALVAILFPVFAGARHKANMTRCQSKMMQLVTALKQYRHDYGKYPPRPQWNAGVNMYTGGFSALYPDYIESWDALICPNDRDIDMKQEEAQDRRYSSYNGKANDPTSDDWDFEYITYNYHGYDADGADLDTPETATLPTWLSDEGRGWKDYPRLMNRNAPDYTLVTHCFRHRDFYAKEQDEMDIILRLNADTAQVNVSQWQSTEDGASLFQTQAN